MQINGSIPIHVARAYGIKPPSTPVPPTSVPPMQAQPVAARALSDAAQQLVGGTVGGAVDFHATTPSSPAGAFQLYTRAADKIEAAVNVELGRSIDVRG